MLETGGFGDEREGRREEERKKKKGESRETPGMRDDI